MGVDDAEDNEADMAFMKVEDFMEGRRKKKREEKLLKQEEEIKKEKMSKLDYQAQFADIKRSLANISRNEWESLPDAPDLVKKTKKQREQAQTQRYMPVPDTVLNQARLDSQITTQVDPGFNSVMDSGFTSTTMPSGMISTNLTELG